jgi:molybdate transport system ATP-binding protein
VRARIVVERAGFALDVDVAVEPAEVVAVLGPNGAGKSTLLRSVCGLTPVTSGRISLGDSVVDDPAAGVWVAPAARRVGVVFQDYRLFPHLTVLDNVAFGVRGESRRDARTRASAWIERLGVGDLAHRKPGLISGGQAQRVALARALACDPAALLLDEPLAALDAGTRLDVRSALREHLHAFSGPTLLVTHDPLDALVLADRIVVLEDGRVTQTGRAVEVARRPATSYVARLLGLNLLRGTAYDGVVTLDGAGVLQVTDHALRGPMLLAIRPAAIALHAGRPEGSARNVWSATVDGVETIGDRVRVALAGAPSVMADVTPAAVAELRLERGAHVWVSTKATEIDVYPG